MRASAMPRIRLARRRQTPALSARNEVHWTRPRNFQARNGDQGEAQSFHLFSVVAPTPDPD